MILQIFIQVFSIVKYMGKSHFQLIILIEPMLRVIGATLILTWRHYIMNWSHYNINWSNGIPWNIIWNPIISEMESYGITSEILWNIIWNPITYPMGYPVGSYGIFDEIL